MRKSLYAFVIVTGILAAIVVIFPGNVYLAFMLSPPIGYVLTAMPMVFLISAAFLIGDHVLGEHGRIIAFLVPALLLAAIGVALPIVLNRSTDAEVRSWSKADRTPSKIQISTNTIALLIPPPYGGPPIGPTECTAICQRLLFNGSVKAVLMGAPPNGSAEPTFGSGVRVMRYRIERRSSCPPVNVPDAGIWDDEHNLQVSYYFISARAKARIAAGECLIMEPADISEADVAIVDRSIKLGSSPCDHWWQIHLDTVTARRLTVYERKDVSMQEIFRQTAIEAYPILMPLFVAPGASCPSDLVMDIGRKRLSISYYNLPRFLKTSTNLNVAPIEDVKAAR